MRSKRSQHDRRRLGQVFLRDPHVVHQILLSASLTPEAAVLEIGPGRGALTGALAEHVSALYAIEIDARYAQALQQRFANTPHVHLIQADAQHYDYGQLPHPLIVIGNLPYSTGTPILRHLFSYRQHFPRLVIMLQKEVGARLAAAPGSSAYSGLSVFFQYYASIQSCFEVPSQAFTPRPAVDSTVLRLEPFQTPPWPSPDEPFLFGLVKVAFAHRRKTLRKNLLSAPQWALTEADLNAIWDDLELSRTARPQELHPRQFVALATAVQRLLPS